MLLIIIVNLVNYRKVSISHLFTVLHNSKICLFIERQGSHISIFYFFLGEPLTYDKNFKGPLTKRSCTDVICLLIFIAFLVCWGVVGYYGKRFSFLQFLFKFANFVFKIFKHFSSNQTWRYWSTPSANWFSGIKMWCWLWGNFTFNKV